jgi:hypothetical protein
VRPYGFGGKVVLWESGKPGLPAVEDELEADCLGLLAVAAEGAMVWVREQEEKNKARLRT